MRQPQKPLHRYQHQVRNRIRSAPGHSVRECFQLSMFDIQSCVTLDSAFVRQARNLHCFGTTQISRTIHLNSSSSPKHLKSVRRHSCSHCKQRSSGAVNEAKGDQSRIVKRNLMNPRHRNVKHLNNGGRSDE